MSDLAAVSGMQHGARRHAWPDKTYRKLGTSFLQDLGALLRVPGAVTNRLLPDLVHPAATAL